jgi:ubiquinone/menaquinone biosynthesis C-methylase UbiE
MCSMQETQHDVVRREFAQQAHHFGEQGLTVSSQAYIDWIIEHLDLQASLRVLDVAAGTGHLSRAIAPHVRHVIAMDLTPEMLQQGQREAAQQGLINMVFEQGEAEHLRYENEVFDLVVTRLSLHHFTDTLSPLREMVRVCRRGGRVAVIDLVAPEDATIALAYNAIERLRDPSHVRALGADELTRVLQESGLALVHSARRDVEVDLERWLDLTGAEPAARASIRDTLSADIRGLRTTGMRPYMRGQELKFLHAWHLVLGRK